MEKLTTKQEQILTEIKKFIASKGYAPTIRELCKLCNLNSTATMFVHLKNLTTKGYISQAENKFRTNDAEIFTLEVNGDSMINAGILDNDIVIVKRQKVCNNGEIVVAFTDENEVTLKRFYKEKDHIRLQPENDFLEPIILNNVTILGKAIGLYRKM